MQIVLMGMRACGKTTVGKLLANTFDCEFVDVDDLIVRRAGKSIADIFATEGEPQFRDIEAGVLEDSMRWTDDRVLSLGGGTVLRESNRDLLKRSGAYRVYLRCDPHILNDRMNADPQSALTRPALTHLGGGLAEVEHLLKVREPLYREVKTMEIDVSHLTPQQVSKMILADVQSDTGRCFPS
jgi:shikimate kinase